MRSVANFESYRFPVKDLEVTAFNVFKEKRSKNKKNPKEPEGEKKEYMVIEIHLGRPGMLIGRYGSTIDALTVYLSERMKMPIDFDIRESKLWN